MCWSGGARASNPFESRRFKYKELRVITDDFRNVIGKGGFGLVYSGKLDGTPVAVKMRSQTSLQGNAEFLAEVHTYTCMHPLIQYHY
jgi:predicted Ser/Thr protein kinase